jgi:hypothetical protein
MSTLNLSVGLPPSNDHGNLFKTVNERPVGIQGHMGHLRSRASSEREQWKLAYRARASSEREHRLLLSRYC